MSDNLKTIKIDALISENVLSRLKCQYFSQDGKLQRISFEEVNNNILIVKTKQGNINRKYIAARKMK